MDRIGPNGPSTNKVERIRSNGPNRTNVDRMDRTGPVWTENVQTGLNRTNVD